MTINFGENKSPVKTDKPVVRCVEKLPDEELDCWDIKPSRLAFIFYLLITLAAFALLLVLWFYDQRHLYELLAVLLGYLLLLYRERSVVYQSRVSFQLRYYSKVWLLSLLPESKQMASSEFKLVGKYPQLRILVNTPLFMRIAARGNYLEEQKLFFVWRDQLTYSKWRYLQSRLAAP